MRRSLRHFFRAKYTARASTSVTSNSAASREVVSSPDFGGDSQSAADTATKASACGHVCHIKNARKLIEAIAVPVALATQVLIFFAPAQWLAPLWLASLLVTAVAVASIAARLLNTDT